MTPEQLSAEIAKGKCEITYTDKAGTEQTRTVEAIVTTGAENRQPSPGMVICNDTAKNSPITIIAENVTNIRHI